MVKYHVISEKLQFSLFYFCLHPIEFASTVKCVSSIVTLYAVFISVFYLSRKDDAFYDSLAAKAVGGGEDMSELSDADPNQLLREMVRPCLYLSYT